MFYTYILFSKSKNRYYIGFTSNLKQRVTQHNTKHKGFTASATDWEIVYTETFETESQARSREKQIKRWKSRKKIDLLINNSTN